MKGCLCAAKHTLHALSRRRPGNGRLAHSTANRVSIIEPSRQTKTGLRLDYANDPTKALLEWSESVNDDSEAQFLQHEEKRQAFSTALQTISDMSPRSGVKTDRTATRANGSQDFNAWTRKSQAASRAGPPAREKDLNPAFWQQLYELTRSKRSSEKSSFDLLRELFEDSRHVKQRTVYSYTIAMAHCVRSSNFKLLRHFVALMHRDKVPFDTQLCNTMLGIFISDRSLPSWTTALRLFASLGIRADTSTWNQLLTLSDRPQKRIVIEQMQACNIPRDSVTMGIMLPLQDKQASCPTFFQPQEYHGWTPTLGDVFIGNLLARHDILPAINLLDMRGFPASIDAYNQVFSALKRAPVGKYKWSRVIQQVCQSMHKRHLKPDARSFLLLYQLGRFFKSLGYREMIFKTAEEHNLANALLKKARDEQVKLQAQRKARQTQVSRTWDWQDFLIRDA